MRPEVRRKDREESIPIRGMASKVVSGRRTEG